MPDPDSRSLINITRPPAFCPGCSHEPVVKALDRAFGELGLMGNQIALVSDIGCSGLFDTFFNTHAFHGLHGRALTYAAGIKLIRPDICVVVTMGDGGLGIGGAHILAACRRNLDITLLVLNNFNFGMTGGQFSVTTPPGARVGSGFLNRIERPMDLAEVAVAAGAPYVARASCYQHGLAETIKKAITYKGFSIIDLWGVCPGRFLRFNKLNPRMIEEGLKVLDHLDGPVARNHRPEYGQAYRAEAATLPKAPTPAPVEVRFEPMQEGRQEVIFMGSAGQRVITAGEILGLAGLSAGLRCTQKNEYNITVLRGLSLTEVILSRQEIDYTGIASPTAILALAPEGVARRHALFGAMDEKGLIIKAAGLEIPDSPARVMTVDFRALGLKGQDWALAALGVLARQKRVINQEMLDLALSLRFKGDALEEAKGVLGRLSAGQG
ncbi:MAG: thiamine pyrophosphate-dependent enzyme [Thermodesulfobacteriota bacterium]